MANEKKKPAPYYVDAGKMLARARKVYRSFPERHPYRVEAMSVFLGQTVKLVNEAARHRANVKLGEEGLTQFDYDLARIQARLRTYREFFTIKWPGEPKDWTEQDWAYYEEMIEGPILFYNRRDWDRLFSGLEEGFGMPKGSRPDYLEGWSLTNQVFTAKEHQVELVGTIWGFAQIRFEEMTASMVQDMKEIGRAAVALAEEIVDDAVDYIKRGASAAIRSPAFWTVLVVGGVVLYAVKRRRSK